MLNRLEIEDRVDTNCWKYAYLYRIPNTRRGKLNGSTSFTIYNMHYVNFRIRDDSFILLEDYVF